MYFEFNYVISEIKVKQTLLIEYKYNDTNRNNKCPSKNAKNCWTEHCD